jgi:hypothetical protein
MMLHVLIARVAGWIQDHQQQVITRPNSTLLEFDPPWYPL